MSERDILSPMADPSDDPLDEAYVPIPNRSPAEQARWWAVGRKRKLRQDRAVMSRGEESKRARRDIRLPRVWNEET